MTHRTWHRLSAPQPAPLHRGSAHPAKALSRAGSSWQQIRASRLSSLEGLLATPRGDLLVVTAQQHLRHVQPTPAGRLGVYRSLEQTLVLRAVRLLDQRLRIADHSGQQTYHSLDHHHRSHFTATENVIADAQLVHPDSPPSVLNNAGIDSLVPTAGEDQVLLFRQLLCKGLIERPSGW